MDFSAGLVLDTSIWINLLATRRFSDIVACLSAKWVAAEQVVSEVLRDPISQVPYLADQHPLRGQAGIEIVDLSGKAIEHFFSLIGQGSTDNLGDGEAATIAIAASRGCAVALDERKARRIVREKHPDLLLTSSFELLRLPQLERNLGKGAVVDAIANATRFGRMHVPKDIGTG